MYYKDIAIPDKDICDSFKEELKKSPQRIMKQIKNAADQANKKIREVNDKKTKEVGGSSSFHDEL